MDKKVMNRQGMTGLYQPEIDKTVIELTIKFWAGGSCCWFHRLLLFSSYTHKRDKGER